MYRLYPESATETSFYESRKWNG